MWVLKHLKEDWYTVLQEHCQMYGDEVVLYISSADVHMILIAPLFLFLYMHFLNTHKFYCC